MGGSTPDVIHFRTSSSCCYVTVAKPGGPRPTSTSKKYLLDASSCSLCLKLLNMGETALNLGRLRQQLDQYLVPSVFPDAPEFEKLAQSYNRVFTYSPAVICLPEKDDDVVNAIKAAQAHGVKVQAKGGGHSYAGRRFT